MACLEDPAHLLDCRLKCFFSAQGGITHPPEGWTPPWRCFTRLKTLSLYFPTASLSSFCLLTSAPPCFFLSDL